MKISDIVKEIKFKGGGKIDLRFLKNITKDVNNSSDTIEFDVNKEYTFEENLNFLNIISDPGEDRTPVKDIYDYLENAYNVGDGWFRQETYNSVKYLAIPTANDMEARNHDCSVVSIASDSMKLYLRYLGKDPNAFYADFKIIAIKIVNQPIVLTSDNLIVLLTTTVG